MNNSSFADFTNLYSLSKTLRFELKPVGKTLENMREHLGYDPELQTFLKDQNIEDAYQTLKPVLDALHEEFITKSLESENAKDIDFTEYFEKYKEKSDEKGEKDLRKKIGELYSEGEFFFKEKYASLSFKKGSKPATKNQVLESTDILEVIKKENETDEKIQQALEVFKGFFTYFGGFNQNRANYYETEKEQSTAISHRIIHENLPKFCDNIVFFEKRKEEYLNAYSALKEKNITLQNKEKKDLFPLSEEIFTLQYFSSCFSQSQIEKYNEIIGNANHLINLYNQSHPNNKLVFFKTLYKQIGCGKKKSLFFTVTHDTKEESNKAREEGKEAFSVEEILDLVEKAGEQFYKHNTQNENTVLKLLEYIETKESFEGMYWSKQAINTISHKYFANYHDIKDKLKNNKIFEKTKKGSEEDVKIPDAVELSGLFSVLDTEENWKTLLFKNSITEDFEKQKIIQASETASKALLRMIFSDIKNAIKNFFEEKENIQSLCEYKSKESKAIIKKWLDYTLAIQQMIKYFLVRENKIKGNPIDTLLSEYLKKTIVEPKFQDGTEVDWFRWYDSLRNYLTKKPQDDAKENKLKLNFENSTLAGGWDINKESSNTCVILQDTESKKYLAIMKKGCNTLFQKEWIEGRGKNKSMKKNPLHEISDQCEIFEKMEYKLLPGPNKMLPKCLLPKSDLKKYGANDEILEIYKRKSFQKTEKNFSISDLHKIIDFYKEGIKKYENWNVFDFKYLPTNQYEDIGQFYSTVEKQGYKLSFSKINENVLNSFIEEGKIYLFEIKNQDFNTGKKDGHKNNLHTIYWNALFQEKENRPKLNGEAEIFYRKAVSEKNLKKKIYKGAEIIENYRFSKEKFIFHVPITLNFCLDNKKTNDLINSILSSSPSLHFLGIDRGEKHLAYYSLVNQKGDIVDQGTLNLPFLDTNGNPRTVKSEKRTLSDDDTEKVEEVECKDYNDLLEAKAGDRAYARKNWQTIGTIKELKEGYLSQVVRLVADLSVEHNAFIVLEDLNTGFKRGRQKIEKSVYQKFEVALAKKLNFLVDKTAQSGEVGSVTRALQLTPPVNNYQDIEKKKQVGIMLYTRANYTSQTDPLTGWRKSIYLKTGSEESIKAQILSHFSDIYFDGKDYFFEYEDTVLKKWKLYSGIHGTSLERFRGVRGKDKNEWQIKQIDIVEILDEVFKNCDKNRSLLSQIGDEGIPLAKTASDHTAWESLRFAIELIQQIRNTGLTEQDNDFLLSPVRNENGVHFDSREYLVKEQQGEKVSLPTSGDANGAFNIARKGIIMNAHIKHWIDSGKPKHKDKGSDLNLFVSDEEWDLYLQDKQKWKESIPHFASKKSFEDEKKKH
jgi:hypothetical protein